MNPNLFVWNLGGEIVLDRLQTEVIVAALNSFKKRKENLFFFSLSVERKSCFLYLVERKSYYKTKNKHKVY